MFAEPVNCPWAPVIIGAVVIAVAWPASIYGAYRRGVRSQQDQVKRDAQAAKQNLRKKFIDLVKQFKTNVSASARRDAWMDFFKDNVVQLVADYETIRPDLEWADKNRMDEAMNTIKRFGGMSPGEISDACTENNELFDALNKFREV